MYSDNYDFIKNSQEVEKDIEETQLYFLILGCVFPFTEIFIELFRLRLQLRKIYQTKSLINILEAIYK